MNIAEKIKAESEKRKDEYNTKLAKESKLNDLKIAKLTPMLNELKAALSEYGFEVKLHNDKSHLPSPAIHIKSEAMIPVTNAYDMISEIFMTEENNWRAGSCNMHKYRFDSDQKLTNHVASAVASLL